MTKNMVQSMYVNADMADECGHSYLKIYRTQKARGVMALCSDTLKYALQALELKAPDFAGNICVFPHEIPTGFVRFARPCPTRPRHGFVDSRKIYTAQQALRIIAETQREDVNGEVIFAPHLSGRWSFVASNAGFSIGMGNAGATGGGKTIDIPCLVNARTWNASVDGFNLSRALDGTPECAVVFVEGVENDGQSVIVQFRGGPEVPGGVTDFVPRKVKVRRVYNPILDDLLSWEKLVREMEDGDVVWYPGSSLLSHYAIHCVIHSVPYLTGPTAPEPGTVLEPTVSKENKPTKEQREIFAVELRRAFHTAKFAHTFWQSRADTLFAVAVSHASTMWPWTQEFSRLRAEALMILLRLTAVACIGEARHFCTSGPGRRPESEVSEEERENNDDENWVKDQYVRPARMRWNKHFLINPMDLREERNFVYGRMESWSLAKLLWQLRNAALDLASPGWAESMGGDMWATAASNGLRTFILARSFIRKPSEARFRRFLGMWNSLAFAVHNGGALLNKFADDRAINFTSACPTLGLLNHEAITRIINVWSTIAKERNGATAIPVCEGVPHGSDQSDEDRKGPDMGWWSAGGST